MTKYFVNDLKLLEEQYIRKVLDVVTSVSQFVLSIIALALLEPIFLLLPLVVITLSIMTPIVFKEIVGKCNKRYSEASNNFITMFGELLSGITVIKNFSASSFIASSVNKAVMDAEYSYASYLNSISLANISFVFAGQLLLLLSFSIGGTMAATGLITVGSIIYISQLLLYTIEPLAVFAGAGTSYASVKNTIAKCTDLLSFISYLKRRYLEGKEQRFVYYVHYLGIPVIYFLTNQLQLWMKKAVVFLTRC